MKDEVAQRVKPEPDDFKNNNLSTNNSDYNVINLRLLIPSKIAGIIIGKGGENIKSLRKEYSSKITIPDSTSFERILFLEGDLQETLVLLEKILEKTIPANAEKTAYLDIRMLVHSSQAGCVIGKSGSKIKELRENSGLKTLKVYQMLCPNSTDRVIQMVGESDKIIGCISNIFDLLINSPVRGSRHQFDTRNSNETLSSEYGGWGSSVIPINRSFTNPAFSHTFVSGNRATLFNDMSRLSSTNGPGGDATAAAMMAAGMMRGTPARMSMAMTSTTQVSVSDKMIGAIMGRAGSRINQVRQESGADIKISNQDVSSEDRIITITGTPDQIQNAQFLLQVCVRKYGEAQHL